MISFVPGYYGHLGNQMFQYAATFALARRLKTICHWPMGKRPDLRTIFPISAERRGMPLPKRYTEPHFHYDDVWFPQQERYTELSGYFQSERYFKDCEEAIRDQFEFPDDSESDAVSIHVRRGDYLSFPEHHPPLTVDYYREAMARFPGERFMVFSDDPGWCLLHLKPLAEHVEIITGNTASEDMHLMSQCGGGHIIANSSFSWWGAWLDPNPDKKVIAPAKWFGPAKADWNTKDLLPEGWIKI